MLKVRDNHIYRLKIFSLQHLKLLKRNWKSSELKMLLITIPIRKAFKKFTLVSIVKKNLTYLNKFL